MNEAVNKDKYIKEVKTAGIWLMLLGGLSLLAVAVDPWFIIDAVLFLSFGAFAYFKKSEIGILLGLISYGIGWLVFFEEYSSILGFILRVFITYQIFQGYMAARRLKEIHNGKHASFKYVS